MDSFPSSLPLALRELIRAASSSAENRRTPHTSPTPVPSRCVCSPPCGRTVCWACLLDQRRFFERMVRRRRRNGPLQAFRTFPYLGGRLLAATYAFEHHPDQNKLRQAEAERAHRRHFVEVGELRGVP